MLRADIGALNAQLNLNALQIRQIELDFYQGTLNAVVTSSSILFAAALNAFGTYFVDPDANVVPRALYFGGMAGATALEFACLITALFAVIMGPNLALRGPEGSMDRAVDGMRDITWQMVRFFVGGLGFFELGLCAYCWVCTGVEWYIAVVLNMSLVTGSLLTLRYGQAVLVKFAFDADEGITDKLGHAAKNFQQVASVTNAAGGPLEGKSAAYTPSSQPANSMVVTPSVTPSPSPAKPDKKKKGIF